MNVVERGQVGEKLPKGWKWVRLGDVSEVVSKGTTPTSLGHSYLSQGVPFLRAEDVTGRAINPDRVAFYISDETHALLSRSQLQTGDLLVTIAGTLGRVGYVPENAPSLNCNQAVAFVRLIPQLINVQYACFACQLNVVTSSFSGLQAGGTIKNLNLEQVRGIVIPLPPLPEQKRIVGILGDRLSTIDKARTATETQLKAAKALPAAYLREVFDSPEAQKWKEVTVDDISSFITDGPHITPTYVPQGVPFLTIRNIVKRKIDLSQVSYISEDDHSQYIRRVKAEKGDILYTKDGTLGIPCVVDTALEFSFFVSVAIIKLLKDRANPYFISFALDSPQVLKQVEQLSAGAGLKHMVIRSIKALKIKLPSIKDQEKIVRQLSEKMMRIEQTQQSLQSQLNTINKLPAALLRQAFNGEL